MPSNSRQELITDTGAHVSPATAHLKVSVVSIEPVKQSRQEIPNGGVFLLVPSGRLQGAGRTFDSESNAAGLSEPVHNADPILPVPCRDRDLNGLRGKGDMLSLGVLGSPLGGESCLGLGVVDRTASIDRTCVSHPWKRLRIRADQLLSSPCSGTVSSRRSR